MCLGKEVSYGISRTANSLQISQRFSIDNSTDCAIDNEDRPIVYSLYMAS